jgi:tetratricopeptide (TPR) repeat protein
MATVSPHGIQMHRVPAALLRARSGQGTDAAAAAGWSATVIMLLDRIAPADVRRDQSGWAIWSQLLPHVLAVASRDIAINAMPADATRLLDRAATYLRTRGEPRAAREPYERAHNVRRERFGNDHPDTLTSASHLALNLWWQGEYQQACALDEDTLTRRRRTLGDDHPDTHISVSQLATDLFALAKYTRARKLQEEVLGQRRRILGDDEFDTLRSAGRLGVILWCLGDYPQALQLQNDAFLRSRRVLGENHSVTLALVR